MTTRLHKLHAAWLAGLAALAASLAVSIATVTAGGPPPTDCTASNSQRIEFAPGEDNATVQASTPPGTAACFILRASAGQTITVSVSPAAFAALTNLIGPDGSVVAAWHTSGSATLPATGDYIIDVGNTGSTPDFAMTVRIPPLSAPTTAPATTSAQLPATR